MEQSKWILASEFAAPRTFLAVSVISTAREEMTQQGTTSVMPMETRSVWMDGLMSTATASCVSLARDLAMQ